MINALKIAINRAATALKTAADKAMSALKEGLKNFWQNLRSGQWLKSPIFWARFLAYAIPLGFLLYVLYINYLPFGYNKTFVIDVGGPDDTRVSEFYLEPSRDLSDRKVGTDEQGNEYTYRELNGVAYAVFKPNVVLKDAEITVSVEGDGVSIIPPVIDFNPDEVEWDYNWDFTKEIPKDLVGNAFVFDGEVTFNGRDTRLELPYSSDMFEDGPFTVYAEWLPKDSQNNAQQIVGHYNWELWQNKDNVEFRVGRMNGPEGQIYSVKYPLEPNFFNQNHTALAVYSPATNIDESGYMELYIDNNFVDRLYFGQEKIWKWYGNKNLSLGKSEHGSAKNITGKISNIKMLYDKIIFYEHKLQYKDSVNNKNYILLTLFNAQLNEIRLDINK